MQYSLSGAVLSRDLIRADGRLVASRGAIVNLAYLKALAAKAPRGLPERPLLETSLAESVLEAFDESPLQHLIGGESNRALAADALAKVRFPQAVWDELGALRKEDEPRYFAMRASQKGLITKAGNSRMRRQALQPGVSWSAGQKRGAAAVQVSGRLSEITTNGGRRMQPDDLRRPECLGSRDDLIHPIINDGSKVHAAGKIGGNRPRNGDAGRQHERADQHSEHGGLLAGQTPASSI